LPFAFEGAVHAPRPGHHRIFGAGAALLLSGRVVRLAAKPISSRAAGANLGKVAAKKVGH
jgi:hypothetical protein